MTNFKGIYLTPNGKWEVRVWDGQGLVNVGRFETLGEALGARDAAFSLITSDDVLRYNKVSPGKAIQELLDQYTIEALWVTPLKDLVTLESKVFHRIPDEILIGGVNINDKPSVQAEERREIVGSREIPLILEGGYERIMAFADLHAPYQHPDAIAFLREVAGIFSPELIVNLGDEIDSAALSFYPQSPEMRNATAELRAAQEVLQELDDQVIRETPCYSVESNHTSRMYRKAKSAGIPKELILPYEQALGVDWEWSKDLIVKLPNGTDLFCTHTKGSNTLLAGQSIGSNIIAGHYHRRGSTMWWVNGRLQHLFATHCPCLIDFENPAYSYDENAIVRPVLGCLVIINSYPIVLIMPVGSNNRWTGDILRG